MANCCSCRDIERLIDRKLARIYQIIGFPKEPETIEVNAEQMIKAAGGTAYNNFNDLSAVEVANIPQLQAAIAAALFYRGGFHRLPATVPEDVTVDNNDTVKIHDGMSWQEWMVKQLDAISGEFPIKIKHKDGDGNEKEIVIQNQAEALAELLGMALSLDADTDFLSAMAVKGASEAAAGRAAAATAADWGKAIADYMGFRVRQDSRTIPIAFNPRATTLKGILQKSTLQQPQVEFDDKKDLQEVLSQLLVYGQIAKAALFRKFEVGDLLPGERIRQDRNNPADDAAWNAFVAAIENPPTDQLPPNTPRPDIRSVTEGPTP
jgi:hypothetical protein